MENVEVLFYVLGFITAVYFIRSTSFKAKYKELLKEKDSKNETIVKLTEKVKSLAKYKEERESKKRRARLVTTGWHHSSESSNPNKKTWDVVFELKEVAVSVDEESKSKFDVIDVFSKNTDGDDAWGSKNYIDWFMKSKGGGWIKTDGKNFEWVTNLSKTEIRDDKLDQLGIQ